MTDQTDGPGSLGSGSAAPPAWSPPTPSGYRGWALFLLLVVYTSNFIDRTIVNIVGQAIKTDLKLTDLQLGLLGGVAFAVFYALLGVFFGWLADRMRRSLLITLALTVWSGFTAACGLAGSFTQLFLLRVGVGVGEAGCSPAAQSLISDYYSPKSRSTALAIYSMGIPLGSLFGALAGGWIAQTFGWRQAFMVVGLPGLALALVCLFALKEPKRGAQDATYDPAVRAPGPITVFRRLFRNRSFVHMTIGATLGSMASYGITGFAVAFLLRGPFDLDLKTAGAAYGLVGGLAATLGVFLGGALTDWAGRASKRSYAIAPGIGFLIAAPLYVMAFLQSDLMKLAAFVIVPLILQYLYLGPTFAVSHNLVAPRMRATATALLFLPINLIGYGLGPVIVGLLSDTVAQRHFTHAGVFKALCPGGAAAKGAEAALATACHAASFDGVKWAIVLVAGVVYAWAGLHYLLAARSLKADLARAEAGA
jgi:predicted MFS family arabinose efflux permease